MGDRRLTLRAKGLAGGADRCGNGATPRVSSNFTWPHEVSDGTTPSVLFLSDPSNLSGGRFGWEMGAEVLGQSLALVVAQLAHP